MTGQEAIRSITNVDINVLSDLDATDSELHLSGHDY